MNNAQGGLFELGKGPGDGKRRKRVFRTIERQKDHWVAHRCTSLGGAVLARVIPAST